MSYVADKLEAIDSYFEQKKEGEKWFMILFFAGVVAFFAYSSFFPYAKSLYDSSVAKHKRINKKIHESKTYLASISKNGDQNYKENKLAKKVQKKKKTLAMYDRKMVVIDGNLNKLSDLLFNQKSWSLFLNSLTERAGSNGVELNELSNKYVDGNGSFGHVLEIGLVCKGEFENLIRFMNDIEQNTLVTDIYQSRIYTDTNSSSIMSDINISVWGVNH